jgi:prophage endopeptidase
MSTVARYLVAALVAGLVAALWRLDSVSAERDTAVATAKTQTSVADSLRSTLRLGRELLTELQQLDEKNTEELNDALEENKHLRADVDAGRQRLRLNATCSSATVPADPGAAGLADAGTAELTADARQDYFTLRDQLALTRQQVLGLQDYVRNVCQHHPTNFDQELTP